MRALVVGVAGCFGAMARYGVDRLVGGSTGGGFPWATFAINVSGCFLLGFLVTVMTSTAGASSTTRAALTIGFVGSYTTFSTFAYEAFRLGDDGRPAMALVYLVASVIVGVVSVAAGIAAGKAV